MVFMNKTKIIVLVAMDDIHKELRTLFYSNMTVPLCIRQGSKRNDDSVSVEELDWSAESQVIIPAEHLWCDFKCRP